MTTILKLHVQASYADRPNRGYKLENTCTSLKGSILDTRITEIDPGFGTWSQNASWKSHKQVKVNLEAACSHYNPYSPRIGLAVRSGVDLNPL